MSQRFFRWVKKYELLLGIIIGLLSLLVFWNIRLFVNHIAISFVLFIAVVVVSLLCLYSEKSQKSYIWHDSWLYTIKLFLIFIATLAIIYLYVSSQNSTLTNSTNMEKTIADVIIFFPFPGIL